MWSCGHFIWISFVLAVAIAPKTALALSVCKYWQRTSSSMLDVLHKYAEYSPGSFMSQQHRRSRKLSKLCFISHNLFRFLSAVLILPLDHSRYSGCSWSFSDLSYVLTDGGPAHATETFSTYIHETPLAPFSMGQASTIVVYVSHLRRHGADRVIQSWRFITKDKKEMS